MSRRLKIIFLTIIAIIVIALLVYLIYRLTRPSETTIINGNVAAPTDRVRGLDDEKIPEVLNLAELSPSKREELMTRADLERFSSLFAERYASYSLEVDFANWQDLEVFMTARLQEEIEAQVEQKLSQERAEGYEGTSAKALAAEITEYDDLAGKATAAVTLQKRVAEGQSSNFQIVYQALVLNFIKEESQGWKVDGVKWK